MGILDAPLTPATLGRGQNFRESLVGSGLVPVGTRPRSFMDTVTRLSDGSALGRMYRTMDTAAVDIASPRLVFGNRYFSGTTFLEAGGPNRIFVRASIEVLANSGSSAALFPVTFGGSATGVVEPGKEVITDPIPHLVLLAGQQFFVRTWVYVATLGEKWPLSQPAAIGASNEGYADTDLTQTMSGWTANSVGSVYAPLCVVGASTAPTVGVMGDSIGNGYNDTPNYQGFVSRALNGKFGWASGSTDSDKVQTTTTSSTAQIRLRTISTCKYAVVHYGRNDLSGGRTAAQIETDLMNLGRILAALGSKAFACTVPPRTTSTDGWATTGNQTPHSSEAQRVLLNQWIRAGLPIDATTKAPVAVGTGGALLAGTAGHPWAGKFDTGGAVESATDSGLWKAGYTNTDGIHPNATGYAAMATAMGTASFI